MAITVNIAIGAGAVGTTELANSSVTPAKLNGVGPGDVGADAAGAAAAAQAASQPVDSDLTAIAALTTTAYGRALLELANAAAGRTALGLGTAATSNTGDFDPAGSAAAAQAASQPVDSDLTAIAALTTTSFGRALLELANAAAGRTAFGLGTAATSNTGDFDAAGAAAAAQAAAIAAAAIDATTKANAAQSAAEATAAGALSTHEGDTTNVHGIANTALLMTGVSGTEVAYTGTPMFTAGAAPSGASSLRQFYTRVGNLVTWQVSLTYAVAGTTVTNLVLTFPTEFPTPGIPTGFTGANMRIWNMDSVRLMSAPSGTIVNAAAFMIVRNAGDTAFDIASSAAFTSGTYRSFIFSGSYFTA